MASAPALEVRLAQASPCTGYRKQNEARSPSNQQNDKERAMHSAGANSRTKGGLNISGARLGFGPARLAAPAIRGVLVLAVLFALLPMAARPAQAQTETVLYNFTGFSD